KALYAMQPNFPPGKLPGNPAFSRVYFNMSQGEGDMRGSWNSDKNFEYVSDREKQLAVDGGNGMAEVMLNTDELERVEQMAARTMSDPTVDPVTGTDLGSGLAPGMTDGTAAIDPVTGKPRLPSDPAL